MTQPIEREAGAVLRGRASYAARRAGVRLLRREGVAVRLLPRLGVCAAGRPPIGELGRDGRWTDARGAGGLPRVESVCAGGLCGAGLVVGLGSLALVVDEGAAAGPALAGSVAGSIGVGGGGSPACVVVVVASVGGGVRLSRGEVSSLLEGVDVPLLHSGEGSDGAPRRGRGTRGR